MFTSAGVPLSTETFCWPWWKPSRQKVTLAGPQGTTTPSSGVLPRGRSPHFTATAAGVLRTVARHSPGLAAAASSGALAAGAGSGLLAAAAATGVGVGAGVAAGGATTG